MSRRDDPDFVDQYQIAFEMSMEADDKLRQLVPGTPEHEKQQAECCRLRDRRGEHCPRCRQDKKQVIVMRYSMGIPAGKMCGDCWDKSGYRKVGRDAFDHSYAGENYSEEDAY